MTWLDEAKQNRERIALTRQEHLEVFDADTCPKTARLNTMPEAKIHLHRPRGYVRYVHGINYPDYRIDGRYLY